MLGWGMGPRRGPTPGCTALHGPRLGRPTPRHPLTHIHTHIFLQENENILLSASGDGSIKVWDVSAPPQANPLRSFEEHKHEVSHRVA